MTEAWEAAWQPVIDAVGEQFADDSIAWGADVVEAGSVRRYLEPLEFDCALHYDSGIARRYGYSDVIAPYTSLLSFTLPPLWSPGEKIFTDSERNAQPAVGALRPHLPPQAPPFTGYFATDIEMDFLRPVTLGERLGRRGAKLIACTPKQTRVGRGAFLTIESDVVSSLGDVVAHIRSGLFCYTPSDSADDSRS